MGVQVSNEELGGVRRVEHHPVIRADLQVMQGRGEPFDDLHEAPAGERLTQVFARGMLRELVAGVVSRNQPLFIRDLPFRLGVSGRSACPPVHQAKQEISRNHPAVIGCCPQIGDGANCPANDRGEHEI